MDTRTSPIRLRLTQLREVLAREADRVDDLPVEEREQRTDGTHVGMGVEELDQRREPHLVRRPRPC